MFGLFSKKSVQLETGEPFMAKLIKREQIAPDVIRLTFALPNKKAILGLPICKHLMVHGVDSEGNEVKKPYTPITVDRISKGEFILVVKVYENGRLGNFLNGRKEGDEVKITGPVGRIEYKDQDFYQLGKLVSVKPKKIGLIGGGSGITPLLQLVRYLEDQKIKDVKCTLLYSNKTQEDILCKEIIDQLVADKWLTVHHNITRGDAAEGMEKGRVTTERIKSCIGNDADFYYCCGPEGLSETVGKCLKEEMGISADKCYGVK